MPIDCAEHPTFPGSRVLCPGAPFSLVHPGELGTNLCLPGEKGQWGHSPTALQFGDKQSQWGQERKEGLRPLLALNAPFWLQGRGVLGAHPRPHGFDVPRRARDLHPSAFGEPRPPVARSSASCAPRRHAPALLS